VRAALEAGQVDEACAYLLVNLIATYLPLSNDERSALQVILEQQGDTTLEATELTWADQLVLQGRKEALRETILRAARLRFGNVSPALEQAVQALAGEEDLLAFFDRTVNVLAFFDRTINARSEADLLSAR
jgi:hypothetical protein